MKKPRFDTRLQPGDTVHGKDKRSLVLFLLGLVLLLFDVWPFAAMEVRPVYHVTVDGNIEWRVLNIPADFLHEQRRKKAFGLMENSPVYPLVPDQGTISGFPAELSLYINRPLPINRADKKTLEMLPGVGPHLADAILNELQYHGKFAGPDDLLAVRGIGPKSLQRLLPLISFEE